MKTADSSKKLVAIYQYTRRLIPEDRNLNSIHVCTVSPLGAVLHDVIQYGPSCNMYKYLK
jgi:hypothetical protein